MIKCSKCQETKADVDFHWANKTRGIRQRVCKACRVNKKPPVWTEDGRVCRDCKEFKSLDNYYFSQNAPVTRCKSCYSDWVNEKIALRPVASEDEMRNCNSCNEIKSISEYSKDKSSPGGRESTCRACRRVQRSLYTWGININGYTHCSICSEEFDKIKPQAAVDHDHSCCPGRRSCGKCVRGVLCHRCNQGLGLFRDNPAYLEAAADYLKNGARI